MQAIKGAIQLPTSTSNKPYVVSPARKSTWSVRSRKDTKGYVLLTSSNWSVEQSLEDAGLSVITFGWRDDPDELYALADAIVIPGGGDVHPAYYNHPVHTATYPDTTRDAHEYHIAQMALADDKPILGICRGHQMLNVAAGGTLCQDVQDVLKVGSHVGNDHLIYTEKGLLLDELSGSVDIVNSLHHQCVHDLADGFQIMARAEDGVPEAIVCSANRFAVGVQFHPELMPMKHTMSRGIFESLADATLERKLTRSNRSLKRSQKDYVESQSAPTSSYGSYYGDYDDATWYEPNAPSNKKWESDAERYARWCELAEKGADPADNEDLARYMRGLIIADMQKAIKEGDRDWWEGLRDELLEYVTCEDVEFPMFPLTEVESENV